MERDLFLQFPNPFITGQAGGDHIAIAKNYQMGHAHYGLAAGRTYRRSSLLFRRVGLGGARPKMNCLIDGPSLA